MIRVSVIIPAYNRSKMLERTLNSLCHQTLESDQYEIIVADNASSDDTVEVVEACAKREKVKIQVFTECRRGVHYARNSAAKLAQGEFLYYTDDDMEADPDMLRSLLDVFEKHPEVGCATGRVLPLWEQEPPEWMLAHCTNNGLLSLQLRSEELVISKKDVGVWSCHEMFRREFFFKTNGFHPENTAGEWVGDGETGLHRKMASLGCLFAFVGGSVTHHMIPPERLTQRYLNHRMINQGNSDSFARYREFRQSDYQLLRGVATSARRLVSCFISSSLKRIKGDDIWHLRRARCYYHIARIKYDLRIYRDPAWVEMILQESWLDE